MKNMKFAEAIPGGCPTEIVCCHCETLMGYVWTEVVSLSPILCDKCFAEYEAEMDDNGAQDGEEFEVDDPIAETEKQEEFEALVEERSKD